MLDSNLLIHIGYPKTASTWLQQGLFKREDMGFFSPWRSGWSDPIAVDQFITMDSFSFCPQDVYHIFEPDLRAAQEKSLCAVLSQEMLSCNFLDQNGYWGQEVADRLHQVFPNAKILVIIREQKSMILSAYGQNIRNGGRQSIRQFIDTENFKSGYSPVFRLKVLNYDLLINYYQNLFGKHQVLVLPFELLKQDSAAYLETILNFAGCNKNAISKDCLPLSANPNYQPFTLKIHKTVNLFFPFPYRGYRQLSDNKIWKFFWKAFSLIDKYTPKYIQDQEEEYLRAFIADHTKGLYIESNRKTNELTGIDLARFGYEC
ncbi:MAG: hypothetical protein GC158_03735 [Cyanobacteria bacterium RI_101]|nr:hypothetical protein [Cyanobacteria bacterium RI_101]